MGIVYVEGTVTGPHGERRVSFLVDSGVAYSLLPNDVWRNLGLQAKRRLTFTLVDGTTLQRDVSECHVAVAGQDGHTPVILGEPGDTALLGTVTLEILALVLNPFKRTLSPMQMILG